MSFLPSPTYSPNSHEYAELPAPAGGKLKPKAKKFAWATAISAVLGVIAVTVCIVVVLKANYRPLNVELVDPTPTPLNPALHKSFYGVAYTPRGAIMPECGTDLSNIKNDIQLLSQLTTRIRLYGSDCNVTSNVLAAIQETRVDLKTFIAIYLEPSDESYVRQKDIIKEALATYGTENVLGVVVGHQYVLQETQRGDSVQNATSYLVGKIMEVRVELHQAGYNVPVGTCEVGSMINQDMVNNVDFILANNHPWFSQNTAEQASAFANTYYEGTLKPLVASSIRSPTPQVYYGEYGWPSGSDTPGTVNAARSPASIASLQRVLDDWVCPAKAAGTPYFWFSAFDEPWKAAITTNGTEANNGIEAHWGLFDKDSNLKPITIPNCP